MKKPLIVVLFGTVFAAESFLLIVWSWRAGNREAQQNRLAVFEAIAPARYVAGNRPRTTRQSKADQSDHERQAADYLVEPPDILLVEVERLVPRELVAEQQIGGEHLVDPDGKISLGSFGDVCVANMTIAEACAVIEQRLREHFAAVELGVSVAAYNSKVFFVIVESPAGDQVYRYPCADQVTVLDAVSQIPELAGIASKQVWVKRPLVNQSRDEVLSVDWQAIVREQDATSNFSLQSRDRVYVADRGATLR